MGLQTRPPKGGTPGGMSQASKNDPGDSSPGTSPGVKGEGWATFGFMEEKPVDPSANQGCSDVLDYDKRNQTDPKERFPRVKEDQRGDIEPFYSDWV